MKDSIRRKLEKLDERFEEISRLLSDAGVIARQSQFRELSMEYSRLGPLVERYRRFIALERDFGSGEVMFERHAEMRYTGQRHNIKVPISGLADPAAIREAFDRDYKRRYGHADPKAAAELQALHLCAFTRLDRPELARLPRPPAT